MVRHKFKRDYLVNKFQGLPPFMDTGKQYEGHTKFNYSGSKRGNFYSQQLKANKEFQDRPIVQKEIGLKGLLPPREVNQNW